jgi:cytochrome c oxidase subunit 2
VRKPLFRNTKRLAIIVSVMLLSSFLLAACGENSPSILNPEGPVAASEATLFYIILGIATFVFIVVEGVLVYSIFRYRERPNSPAPRQIHGNNTIEIAWTVAPAIFLFIALGATIYTMFTLYPSGGPQLQVRVVAHQWWWEFDYTNYPGSNGHSIVTADTMHIPAGTVINAQLYSNNVIHSFWVPALTGKLDVIPGHDNHLLFEAYTSAVGHTFPGECVEFCGSQHAHMHFDVVVDNADSFNTWISGQQQAAAAQNFNGLSCNPSGPIAQSDLVACGAKFFAQGACVGCHGIVGVNLTSYDDRKGANLIGPNLTHFGSRDLIAGGVLPNTPQNLATWLANPQAVKPGSDMPQLGLSPNQINALVAYLESLK